MLAGFYGCAVLLRFEYPMMVVTKTKEIFMKRLKRNKKMLTEQGSSDQSRSKTLSRSIQLHTNTFLDSVDSSELSKKTAQLKDELFPEFKQLRNNDRSYDSSIHDIHNPSVNDLNSSMAKKEEILAEDSFADKLIKLSNNISFNQIIDVETIEINLSAVQADVASLICDFDQIDRETTIQTYQKLRLKEKQNVGIPPGYILEQQLNRFRKKQKMVFTSIDQMGQYVNQQKTLQNLKYRRVPKQTQYSGVEKQLKSRNYYQQQNNNPRMSGFHQARNSMFNTSEQRFQKLEQSYKTLQRFRPTTNFQRTNQQQLRHIYKNMAEQQRRAKAISYQQNYLPRHRSNNQFQGISSSDQFVEIEQFQRKTDPQFYMQTKETPIHRHYEENIVPIRYSLMNQGNSRYPNPRQPQQSEQRCVTEFDLYDQNQRAFNSPKFKDLRQQEKKQSKCPLYYRNRKIHHQTKMSHHPITTEKLMVSERLSPMEKYSQNRVSVIEQLPLASYHQANYEERQEKKKRLREKAAQLLSRVKSHQYLATRIEMTSPRRY